MPPGKEDLTLDRRLFHAVESLERIEQRRKESAAVENTAVNRVLAEVQGLRAEIREEMRDVREDIKGVKARLSIVESSASRRSASTPPPSGWSSGGHELELPVSKSGSVSLEAVQNAWSTKLVELDEEVRLLRADKEAEEKAKQMVIQSAEADRKRWLDRAKLAVALSPLLPIAGAFLAKVLHLI
jgi:hypothetical protein